jgi:glycosyltransferase involved in cell wall biosynthesis
MTKLAFIMHNFNGGGAERVTINLATLLAEEKYEVTIIVKENKGELSDSIPSNIKVLSLDIDGKNKIAKNIKVIKSISSLLNSNYFDCMISVSRSMNNTLAIAKRISVKSSTPIIGTIHNSLSQEVVSYSRIKKIINNLFDKFFYKIVVVSEEARQEYEKEFKIDPSKLITIYNPVVDDTIVNASEEECNHPWLSHDRKFHTIINAGRLTYQKDHLLLLRMFKELKKEKDARLIILGNGELREDLIDYCKTNQLEDYVDFVGFVKNPYKYFSNADAFVLSSKFEGLPTVLIEALACKLNVVSVNCPTGPREILNDGEYGFISERTVGDLKDKTITCLEKPMDKDFIFSRANSFTFSKSKEKYKKLIEDSLK